MGINRSELSGGVLALPTAGMIFEIPINSPAYTSYLAALKRIEEERDRLGYPSTEAFGALTAAVESLNKFAWSRLPQN